MDRRKLGGTMGKQEFLRNDFWGVVKLCKRSDVVIEVVDSREPLLTRSVKLERVISESNIPLIIVLNKSDLVPVGELRKWEHYIRESTGTPVVPLSTSKHMGTKILRDLIKEVADHSLDTIKSIVVGYPKTGKSSLINSLKGKRSASVSSVPKSWGFTKNVQLYRIDDRLYIWDTPGVIPPDGDLLERVIRGFPPESLEDPVKPATKLITRLKRYGFADQLERRYRCPTEDPYRFLECIALNRKLMYKDGELNVDEASRAFIRDYHNGYILYFTPFTRN